MNRIDELHAWLGPRLPASDYTLEPASADASFRRYFRAKVGDRTWVVMDAPPAHEDCRPFVRIAGLLHEAGLNAPQILDQDLDRGFLLLSDLGVTTYLAALRDRPEDAPSLFDDALEALVIWQLSSRPDVLPPYDDALLRRELGLFPEWYLGRHLSLELSQAETKTIADVFDVLVANVLAQPKAFVHRDYMPRNLMVTNPNPGILDFQDAVYGPLTYDVASLFRDAFISWEERQVLDWTIRYWERARKSGLPVNPDFAEFYRDVEWMGMQRHLKVLGIFARLRYRDGKQGYLEDTPRFLKYVRATAERYGELRRLVPLLDRIEARAPQIGLTF